MISSKGGGTHLCEMTDVLFFFLCDVPIKLAQLGKGKKKKRTWEAPHLII
jgi:hypothetical protein